MEVNTTELRHITTCLLDHLENMGQNTIQIPHDYYWAIPTSEKYQPYSQPTDLSLGQLSEDLNELRKLLQSDSEPIAYAFVWLASILCAIGEDLVV